MLWLLLILVFIRPFISSLAFPYLNSLYSTLFLVFLIIWFIYKGIPIKKITSLKYPLILFCLALIISVVFSLNKLNSFKELYKYLNGLLLFLIAFSLTNEDRERIIRTIILASFIISLLAIYQYFFGFQHILDYITKSKIADSFTLDYINRKRVFFPFVTPNTLGGYLAMIIPLTLSYKKRVWLIIPLSLALLLTKSLGALLSIFLGLMIYSYLQGRFERKRILFLIGLAIIIGLVFLVRSTASKQHLQPIFSTGMRLNYWKDTLSIIKTVPFTGVGLGNFNLEVSRYAHNSYLQIWAEMGILGITSILWLIIKALNSAIRNFKDSPYKNQIVSLICANAVFLVHNLMDFTFFLPETVLVWWAILGSILS